MPPLLIAGTTGTESPYASNALIISMLMTRRPDELKMLLIDPKKNEFSDYRRIPHLMHPVITTRRKRPPSWHGPWTRWRNATIS